jgi:hypothetical protein
MKRGAQYLGGVLALTLLCTALPADAKTVQLRHDDEDFLRGELEGLAVDPAGQLVMAHVVGERWETEGLYVWCLAQDERGRLLAGTGDGGLVYRQDGDRLQVWARTSSLEILCLLPLGEETLAGSSPDGMVYRINQAGRAEVALELEEQSVWALALGSRRGSWLAGVGPGARLVRGGRGAETGEELHRFPASNLTVLRRDEVGLWIGTQGPSRIYRIEGDDEGEPRLVMAPPHEEIRQILPDGRGGAWILSVDADPNLSGNGKESRISWIGASGSTETLFESEAALLSLERLSNGAFLAGEAESGRLLHLDERGHRSLWLELDGGDPLALLAGRGGTMFVGTGNPGGVVRLRPPSREAGRFESAPLQIEHLERWGRLSVDGFGRELRYQVRSGVTPQPDESWSEWSPPREAGSPIEAPVATHLQHRLLLREASVSAVVLSYAERNLAPRVEKLTVRPAGGDLLSGGLKSAPNALSQRFDDGLAVEYSWIGERERVEPDRAEPDRATWARGLRTISWESEDPNGDPLRYGVELRVLPDGKWSRLAEDLQPEIWAWDTRSFEDGTYRLRVVATDRLANAPGQARTGVQLSEVVHVDNTPPRIERLRWAGDVERIVGEVRDEGKLAELALRLDDGEWRPLVPEDGVVDGTREQFSVEPWASERWKRSGDAQRFWLRVVDQAGNAALRQLEVPALP